VDLSWLEWRSTLGFIFTKRGDSLGDIGVSFLISRCYVSVFSDWLFSVRRIHHLVPSQVKLVNRGAEKSQAEEHVERSQAVVSEHTTTISGVSQWERKPSRCVSVVWSSCISGGQAWWLQIQVPNYSRSDAIISLSKEMIFYLLEECNPFHDDYFWEDILGVICSHLNLPSCSAAASEHTVHYKSSSQLFKSNQLETVTSLDPCAHIGQEIRFFECCILFFPTHPSLFVLGLLPSDWVDFFSYSCFCFERVLFKLADQIASWCKLILTAL